MPVFASEERLARLQQLRARIDAEIRVEKKLLANSKRRREAQARQAENARARRIAPPAAVRAWAIQQGIPVASHGRVPTELREQYLTAHNNQEATPE